MAIIEGSGVAIKDTSEVALKKGDSIDIPKSVIHRIENRGKDNLVFIEVQTGDYFGEDDIERLEDDFGRR
ncbi:MAG: cupin domain-containing protein [Pseudomonadota bacterium]